MDPVVTYEALCALRAADDRHAPELRDAWFAVDRALRSLVARDPTGGSADKEEARQIALIRVMRNVHTIKAESPFAAVAWLRTIYENTLRDLFRAHRRRQRLLEAERDERRHLAPFDAPRGPEAVDLRAHDPAELERFEEALWEFVELFLRAKRPHRRAPALEKAQLAYLRVVKQASMDVIHAEAGDVSRDTLYQWLRRGRVEVLLPAIDAWLPALAPEHPEREFALALAELLREVDRADAGKPRPGRRKNAGPSVSPDEDWKSDQCDDPDEADDD